MNRRELIRRLKEKNLDMRGVEKHDKLLALINEELRELIQQDYIFSKDDPVMLKYVSDFCLQKETSVSLEAIVLVLEGAQSYWRENHESN